jgi:hypothetical protein
VGNHAPTPVKKFGAGSDDLSTSATASVSSLTSDISDTAKHTLLVGHTTGASPSAGPWDDSKPTEAPTGSAILEHSALLAATGGIQSTTQAATGSGSESSVSAALAATAAAAIPGAF